MVRPVSMSTQIRLLLACTALAFAYACGGSTPEVKPDEPVTAAPADNPEAAAEAMKAAQQGLGGATEPEPQGEEIPVVEENELIDEGAASAPAKPAAETPAAEPAPAAKPAEEAKPAPKVIKVEEEEQSPVAKAEAEMKEACEKPKSKECKAAKAELKKAKAAGKKAKAKGKKDKKPAKANGKKPAKKPAKKGK